MQGKKAMFYLNRFLAFAATLMLASNAQAGSTFKVLRSFHCNPSGCYPYGGMALDAAGNLYGTTPGGGNAEATIFKFAPSSGGHWTYSLLYTLTIKQGSSLVSSLTLDNSGNLYGTSNNGGTYDFGTVFELSPDPATVAGWTLMVLHSFDPFVNDGSGPWDKVILDEAATSTGPRATWALMAEASSSSWHPERGHVERDHPSQLSCYALRWRLVLCRTGPR